MNRKYVLIAVVLIVGGYLLFSKKPVPSSYLISDFPYLQQPDNISCGPTSATMVLRHLGTHVELEEVRVHTKTDWFEYHGQTLGMTSPDCISMAMKRFGVRAKLWRGTTTDLQWSICQRKSVIVLLRSGQYTWHYVVVIGYNSENIIIADPGCGCRRDIPIRDFQNAWDFTSDMLGNSVVGNCPVCQGDGVIGSVSFGPLNRCEFCNGRGNTPDVLRAFLQLAEVYPRTMILVH